MTWSTEVSSDGQYIDISYAGKPGLITIKREDEGFVVDIWNEDVSECVATTCATYQDLEEVEDEDGHQ